MPCPLGSGEACFYKAEAAVRSGAGLVECDMDSTLEEGNPQPAHYAELDVSGRSYLHRRRRPGPVVDRQASREARQGQDIAFRGTQAADVAVLIDCSPSWRYVNE